MNNTAQAAPIPFLKGGGEMGELTRNFDWSKTSLGDPFLWPQSLRTSVNIVLLSSFPMLLWWGKDLIQFYNDAFRPSLGSDGKHPSSLGQPAIGYWKENWHIIKPLIDQVLDKGESVFYENLLIPNFRNGRVEDVYWTFSYSPVLNESGSPAAVFMTCIETTETVLARQKLEESEAHLELLSNTVPAMIFYLDSEQRYQSYNDTFMQWFSVNSKEVIGKTVREFIGDNAYKKVSPHLSIAYSGYQEKYEMQIPSQINGERWLSIVYTPHKNEKGEVLGIIVHATDITHNKQTEAVLKESEARFRTMAENTNTFIAVGDESSNTIYFNRAWEELTGRPVKELLSLGWVDLVHPDDKECYTNLYLDALKIRQPFTGEFRVLNSEGKYRWLLAQGVPRFISEGTFAGYISSSVDITGRKEAERKLEQKNSQLMHVNNDLDNFIYTASHDLKAPISNLEGLLNEFTDESNFTEQQQEMIDMMLYSIERFKTTIKDLTDISKAQRLENEVHETIIFNDILEEIKLDIGELIRTFSPKIDIRFDVQGINYSRKNLRSIIYNLLSNALKYSSPDRIPEIRIHTEKKSDFVLLTIADNGLGLSKENQGKIFGMFKRAHTHIEGSGIGLYMIKKMIENEGGRIELKSEPGIGATFFVYLKTS